MDGGGGGGEEEGGGGEGRAEGEEVVQRELGGGDLGEALG